MQGIYFFFYYFIHALVLIILKLCIYAKSISLRHKNDNFSIAIGQKSLHLIYFPSCYRTVCHGTVQ